MGSAKSKPGISAEERWAALPNFCKHYFEYLSTKGGFVLTAEQRVKIANLTLTSAIDCPGCASLPKEACLPPGINLYKNIEGLDAECHSDVFAHMVHSIVNHQTRIFKDPAWYDTTMERLKESNLLDEARMMQEGMTSEQQKEFLYYGLFAEIVLVATCVHGLHMITIMKGEAPPTPIVAAKDATRPSYFDWSKVFHKGKTATHNTRLATTPYVSKANIDTNSPHFKELIPDDKERALLFNLGMVPFTPFLAITWSPVDFGWAEQLTSNFNVATESFTDPHNPLDPKARCSDHFFRRDVEVLAVARGSYNMAPEAREELLEKFAKSATSRPLDRNAIAKVREEVLKELGPEVLVEACGVVGTFECVTKFVDASGKKVPSSTIRSTGAFIMSTRNAFHNFSFSWLSSK
ncbi:expressed unknown protein [Seminavis robusta]|uniref:Uncharacterized protein n=1 Tax=Seminavis robusta TaxID=568900 RepID=A0A9N8EYW8_9STRA|nr:expressed unknown protein [Seminavis robusta]|eukprot:Sro2345_g324180.1 n/a (407) ;mRNA; f:3362-4636